MKTSEVFKHAKAYLWDGMRADREGKHIYICYAIDKAYTKGPVPREDAKRARLIVNDLMAPSTTLEGWLISNGLARADEVMALHNEDWRTCRRIARKKQKTRHLWLDHLIAHYESQGD